MTEERRRHPRVLARAGVRLEAGETSIPGHLCDICRDAALVEVQAPVALGAAVTLFVELEGSGEIKLSGTVIRLAPGEQGHGAAILFSDVSPSAAARIDFFLALQGGPDR